MNIKFDNDKVRTQGRYMGRINQRKRMKQFMLMIQGKVIQLK